MKEEPREVDLPPTMEGVVIPADESGATVYVAKDPCLKDEVRTEVEGLSPESSEDVGSDSTPHEPSTDLPGVSIESVKSETPKIFHKALPDHVRLPNLSLEEVSRSVSFPLPNGIELDKYGTDKRPWMDRADLKIELVGDTLRITLRNDEPGEIEFPVFYNHGKESHFHLTVNPDPWTLWTIKEPTNDQIVFEADKKRLEQLHKSIIHYEDRFLSVAGASRRGRSHEHVGSFRDDDMGYWADEATGRYAFIVADGAGSAKYSREGARLAIEYLMEKLPANLTDEQWSGDEEVLRPDGKVGRLLVALARNAFDHIADFVSKGNEKHPEDKWEVRDFNTTLLIAVVKYDSSDGGMWIVTFSIGDGAIAWYNGEKSGLMCAPDGGEFSGGTRFLTTRSVWETASKDWPAFYNARVFCKKISPEEVLKTKLFLMTDGVSDPWFETDAALHDNEAWRRFSEETLKGEGENQAGLKSGDSVEVKAEKLVKWLHFKIRGNHDDRTLIVVSARNAGGGEETGKVVCNA
jgi:serine/threonine protein phosphatase PrpC